MKFAGSRRGYIYTRIVYGGEVGLRSERQKGKRVWDVRSGTYDVLAGERTGEICLVDILCYKIRRAM
jgi:hypothetical protein